MPAPSGYGEWQSKWDPARLELLRRRHYGPNEQHQGEAAWRSLGGQGAAQEKLPNTDTVIGGRLTMPGGRDMMDEYWQQEKAAADAMRASHQSGESSAALHQSRMAQSQGAQQMRAGMAAGNPLAARAAMGGYGQQAVGIAAEGGMGRADEMNQARLAQMETLGRRGDIEAQLQGLQDQRMMSDMQLRAAEMDARLAKSGVQSNAATQQMQGGANFAATGAGVIGTKTYEQESGQSSDKRGKSSYAYSDRRLKQSMMRGIR